MDAEDRRDPGGHGHRMDTSLLPLKKRASNYITGPGRIPAGGGGDPPHGSSSSKTKKKRTAVAVGAAETKDKDTTGAFEAPVPRQRRSMPAAAASREPQPEPVEPAAEEEELPAPAPAAAAPPAEPAAEGDDTASSEDETKWLSKGKWLARAGDDSSTPAAAAVTPPVEKLMRDGIRSYVPEQLRHPAAGELSEAVLRRLAELRATTRPWLMLRKSLSTSDVDDNQNRLLLSCKRDDWRHHPITRCFSDAELRRVLNKHTGLWVAALDGGVDGGGGASRPPYAITCKYLGSNSGFRFIGGWKEFLAGHGMNLKSQPRHGVWARDVEVEFWAFRSRRLPFQPELGADGKVATDTVEDESNKKKKKKKDVKVVRLIDHHLHPDGELGLVLVLRENMARRVEHEEQEEDDEDGDWEGPPSPPTAKVARNKGKQRSGKRGALAAAAAPPVAEAVPAPVAAEEGGEWEAMSESEQMLWAARGLVALRESTLAEWREQVGRGRGGEEGSRSSDGVATSSADVEEDDGKKKKK